MENVTLKVACDEAIRRQDSLYLMFNCGHLGYGLRYVITISRLVIYKRQDNLGNIDRFRRWFEVWS